MTRQRGRPFKPGQSGNPAGRPPVPDCLTDCLRAVAVLPVQTGETHAQRLAAVLWRKACAGDLRAAALVLDRLEGRPPQGLSVDVRNSEPLRTSVVFIGCGDEGQGTSDVPRQSS